MKLFIAYSFENTEKNKSGHFPNSPAEEDKTTRSN